MLKKISTLLLFLIFTVSTQAQLDRSIRPKPGPAPEIKIGDAKSFQLENGLKVFVVENNKLPRITFSLIIDRDPLLEGDSAGYSSFAGQLLRTGTKSRSKDQLDEEIDFIGASLSTSSTSVRASGLSKHTKKIIDLMADVTLNPNFTQEELDKIKTRTLSSLAQNKEDPDVISRNVFDVVLYGKDHPYGELMTEEIVENISLEMCNNYYKTYYRPNIALMAIVGDISLEKAKELVEKYFGKWEKKEIPTFEYKKPGKTIVNKVHLIDRPNAVQSVLAIGYTIDLPKGDPDIVKTSILNNILGGSFLSRINQNLREDKGYTYGAFCSIRSDELIGEFKVGTTVRNSVTDSSITEVIHELKKIRKEGVTEEELQTSKNYLTGSFSRALEKPGTIASFALSMERYNLPKDYYKTYLQRLNAVTVEDIKKVAKKYIKPNNMNIVVVGKADEIAENIKSFSIAGKLKYYNVYGEEYDPSQKTIPEGVTVESVIDDYITAIGGRENVEKVQDKTTVLEGSSGQMNLTITIMQKVPDMFNQKLESNFFNQETWYDGQKGKMVAMGQESYLEGEELESTKTLAILNPFLDFKSHGMTPELKGIETINGHDTYKVEITLPNEEKWTKYYDIETGLLNRYVTDVKVQGNSAQTIVDYDEYKEVDGVKYPHKLSQTSAGRSIELNVVTIEINKGLDDGIFKVD
ncbi:MAG: insulinase family protein [Ignavibacteria bacterium]|jgi:predicted Zn-dependent peptidase